MLGCLCAPVFFILCATGGIYLFRDEIELLADPSRYFTDEPRPAADRLSIDELVRIVEKQTAGAAETVCWPDSPNRTCRIILRKGDDPRMRLLYDVDPFTAAVKGEGAEKTAPFFRAVKKFHTSLGLPKRIGRPIVLGVTIFAVLLLLTGLILWTPVKKNGLKNWTNRMTVHRSFGQRRLFYDLHNAAGFFFLLPLLALCATGVYLSFSPHGATLASLNPAEKSLEQISDSNCHLESRENALDMILKQKKAARPDLNYLIFRIPEPGEKAPIRLEASDRSWCGFSVADVSYWNPNGGALIAEKCYSDLSSFERLLVILRPLHNGSLFGIATKIFFLIVCVAAASLPISAFAGRGRRRAILPNSNRENGRSS